MCVYNSGPSGMSSGSDSCCGIFSPMDAYIPVLPSSGTFLNAYVSPTSRSASDRTTEGVQHRPLPVDGGLSL